MWCCCFSKRKLSAQSALNGRRGCFDTKRAVGRRSFWVKEQEPQKAGHNPTSLIRNFGLAPHALPPPNTLHLTPSPPTHKLSTLAAPSLVPTPLPTSHVSKVRCPHTHSEIMASFNSSYHRIQKGDTNGSGEFEMWSCAPSSCCAALPFVSPPSLHPPPPPSPPAGPVVPT